MRKIILMTILALALPGAALATPERAGGVADKFAQMDKNGDGQVSWEEFSAVYPQMREAAFEAIDSSKDKFICPDEWQAFSQGHSRDMMSSGMSGMTDGKGGLMMPPPGMGAQGGEADQKVRQMFELAPRTNK